MNPRKVNCADLTPPPTVGRPSSTTHRKPAFARYAAVTRLLCPAPATTMSKRSGLADCCAMAFNGVSARGASAAPFTNPRRVIPLILCLRCESISGGVELSGAKLVAEQKVCQRYFDYP